MSQEIEATTDKPEKDARNWAMICQLSALAGFIVPPVGHVLGPLIVWAVKKDEFPFVDDQGKEALNFQLTITIGYVLCVPLIFIVIGVFMMAALGLYSFIMIIIASIKANDGVAYRFPHTIRFLK